MSNAAYLAGGFFLMAVGITWLLVACIVVGRRADQRWESERTEPRPVAEAEWFAELAATESTPVYDALACEAIERAEGWSA